MAGKSLDYAKITRVLSDRAKLFDGSVVKVGIPANKKYPDGTSIGYVAAIQEYGAPDVGIPSRPFMRRTRAKKAKEWAKDMAEGAKAVMQRRISLDGMLDAVGAVAAADIVQTIADRVPPPLAPATIAARVRRAKKANPKFGAKGMPVTISQPLVDTGALVAHVSYGTGPAGEDFTGGKPVKG
ncbi:MAG: hypothetical protein WBW93_13920 [Steroidobacteraceae bacterium]